MNIINEMEEYERMLDAEQQYLMEVEHQMWLQDEYEKYKQDIDSQKIVEFEHKNQNDENIF